MQSATLRDVRTGLDEVQAGRAPARARRGEGSLLRERGRRPKMRSRRLRCAAPDSAAMARIGWRPPIALKLPNGRASSRRCWRGHRCPDGFTPDQVKRIRGLLADRGVPGLRDLALFSTAIDTMLHGQDLLALVVGDVQRRDGSMRPVIEVARARGMPAVRCALSKVSTSAPGPCKN